MTAFKLQKATGRGPVVGGALFGGALLLSGVAAVALLGRRVAPALAPARAAVTVRRPAAELFALWSAPETLSALSWGALTVQPLDGGRLRWTLPGAGSDLSWDTEPLPGEPGRLARWQSVAGAPLQQRGELRLDPAPGDRGTELRLSLHSEPPAGLAGPLLTRLGDGLAGALLRRFKNLAESGEVPTSASRPAR